MYVCSQIFASADGCGDRLPPGTYGQTADVRNIFLSTLWGCHQYVSPL